MRNALGTATVLVVLFTALSGAPALAGDKDFKAKLQGYQEVPSISTPASGEFKATLSHDETTITYELSYSGLVADVRQAHIHFAQRGVNGSIMIFLCQTATNLDPVGAPPTGAPFCLQEGTVSGTLTAAKMIGGAASQGIAAGDFDELIAALRAGVAYANVHSVTFSGGEIRGQIK